MKRQVKKRIISFIALIAMLLTTVLSTGNLSKVKADVTAGGSGAITELKGGEKVVLYNPDSKNPGSGYVLSTAISNKNKMTAVAANEKDNKIISSAEYSVLEVTVDADNFITLKDASGKYLRGDDNNAFTLSDTIDAKCRWSLETINKVLMI